MRAPRLAQLLPGRTRVEATPAPRPPDEVRLISCVGVEMDLPLLDHFLQHYRLLGIRPARMHLILNAPDEASPALAEALARLKKVGAASPDIWIGAYSSAEMWQRRRKLQETEARDGDWILSADVDELHDYPCALGEVLDHLDELGANVLQGPMIDRLARDGSLPPVDPATPLAEQFPLQADVMPVLGKQRGLDDAAGTLKMMLFDAALFPAQGGHFPKPPDSADQMRPNFAHGASLAAFPRAKEAAFRFSQPALVHHFKWHEGLAESWQARLDRPGGASGPGRRYGERILAHLDAQNGRIDLASLTVAETVRSLETWREQLQGLREQGRLLAQARRQPGPGPGQEAVAEGWTVTQLTEGSRRGVFHAHSYYDLQVLSPDHSQIVAYRNTAPNRPVEPEDRVTVGLVDTQAGGFRPLADTSAWSWQQGPMAQFLPCGTKLAWCDREGTRMIGRVHDLTTGITRTLPRPVYAIDPEGRFTLTPNMARLNRMRPGYGFAGGRDVFQDDPAPEGDGIWRVELSGGASRLILSLSQAVAFLRERGLAPEGEGLTYWFNHPKIAPDGKRFTIKLRWRRADLDDKWTGEMGVSLTCGTSGPDEEGGELRLLAQASSHVMWWDATRLYYWDARRKRVAVLRDALSGEGDGPCDGQWEQDLWPEAFDGNVHIRHVGDHPALAVYDTAYRRQIELRLIDLETGARERVATFRGHVPAKGPYRCDLHPVISADGRSIVVTSLTDGGRQVYLLRWHGESLPDLAPREPAS